MCSLNIGAAVPGHTKGPPRSYTEQRVRRLNVTFAKALMAAVTPNEVAPGVNAGYYGHDPGTEGVALTREVRWDPSLAPTAGPHLTRPWWPYKKSPR